MNDMKTADLEYKLLDLIVKQIEDGRTDGIKDYSPSTNWVQGGPIIEREKITPQYMDHGYWRAWTEVGEKAHKVAYGPTPLIAAMRCYVASRLGDEVVLAGGTEMRPELSDEMHRILVKRITKALEAARYYPATIHPLEDAKKLLEPFREG